MYICRLGPALQILQKERGLTIGEAAGKCEISTRQYAKIIDGESNPRLDTFEMLCRGFDVLPNDVVIFPEIIRQLREEEIAYCYCVRNASSFDAFPVCSEYKGVFLENYRTACSTCKNKICRKKCKVDEIMVAGCKLL